jgi:hypothetical protein
MSRPGFGAFLAPHPKINGYLSRLRTSREFVADNSEYFNRARDAVMARITEIRPRPRRSPSR